MKYTMSKEVEDILKECPIDVYLLMKNCLERYFETGKCPNFTHEELKDFWFYLKTHELADSIQRHGEGFYSWHNSFDHIELKSLLNKNCTKFSNKHYRVGGYHNGTN